MFELSVKRAGLCCCLSYRCALLVVIYITTHISTTGHRLLNAFLFKFWCSTEHKKCSWGYYGLSYACLSGFSAVCCIRVTVLQIHCSRQSAMHRKYPCFLFFLLLLKKASGADALSLSFTLFNHKLSDDNVTFMACKDTVWYIWRKL